MRSYSIAILCYAPQVDHDTLLAMESYRQVMPFASIYLYVPEVEDHYLVSLQKQDITVRRDDCTNRFRLVRRMFTEIDADIFAFVGSLEYQANDTSSMVHQLIEERKDMVMAQVDLSSDAERTYHTMCQGLYGNSPQNPLMDFRVFSRRFVKSFAAFERGFPIELEWTIHALELDIPRQETEVQTDFASIDALPSAPQSRRSLTRLILNLQARPLKWFGLATALCLLATLFYKALFCLNYFGYPVFVDMTHSAIGTGIMAILAFLSALSGLALHSISHQKRELKRLHFQQHSTL